MRKAIVAAAVATCIGIAAVMVWIGFPSFAASMPPAVSVCPAVAPVKVGKITVPAGPVARYCQDRLMNAAHIINAVRALGIGTHTQAVGVMTAMGESGLRVLDHRNAAGADSRGLFQQRDNGAWGTLADRMDPFISATNFFNVDKAAWMADDESVRGRARCSSERRPASFWDDAQAIVSALNN